MLAAPCVGDAESIAARIRQEWRITLALDDIMQIEADAERESWARELLSEYEWVGRAAHCRKDEMNWPARRVRFSPSSSSERPLGGIDTTETHAVDSVNPRELAMKDKDQEILDALQAARAENPDLDLLLSLYDALYTVQFEVAESLSVDVTALPQPTDISGRFAAGRAILAFDDLAVKPETLYATTERIVEILARHGDEPSGLGAELEASTPDSLVLLVQLRFEGGDGEPQGASEEMGLAVDLALAPHLRRAAEAVMSRADLNHWHQGYCPACGGVPDLATLGEEVGRRQLVCARCDTEWPYVRLRCPFCDNIDATQLPYYPTDDKAYRLYVCESCKRYLKTVDLRQVRKASMPAVERVLTAPLDVSAQQMGYKG